jgi:peptidoglycan/xylan/chitin deacetylase (PgdA/CDA1 family)
MAPLAAIAAPRPGDFFTSGPTSAKRIALTFDDGPGPESAAFIDLLKKYDVSATFFMLGEQVKQRPAVAKRISDAGFEIGSHTTRHENYLQRFHMIETQHPNDENAAVAAVEAELVKDMRESRADIEAVTGRTLKILRMPNGVDRPWVKTSAKEAGFVLVNWTFGADWTKASTEELTPQYVNAIKPGAVLLLHDGGSHRAKTLAITEAVIKAAKEKGYEIVPVGQLIGAE